MPNKSHGNVQSRTSSGSVSHKSYQPPPHGMQTNMHFQNLKENRDSNSQSFQSSASAKDSNYLKQHPPHTERDGSKANVTFHGQYSQNSNLQHQGYPHKPETNYSGNYLHREGNRGCHGVQGSGSSNLPQAHHSQNQIITGSNVNLATNQKEYLMTSQRDSTTIKDTESQSQSLAKDSTSSSIRDIISQSVSQKDVHSMTNERKEHLRDKSRMNYIHGSSTTSNYRPESVKPGREQLGLNFHDSTDRKMDDFASKLKDKPLKKVDEEPVIDAVKVEPPNIKTEKFDETDVGDENGTWSLSNIKCEKNNVPVTLKSEMNSGKNELSVDPSKIDVSNSEASRSQSMHTVKMYDPKYKTHHYHSGSKNSEVPQIKIEKPGAQCSSDMHKKVCDRSHEKHRKVQESERIPHGVDGSGNLGDMSKHHKLSKEMSDKNKMLLSGQQGDQRMKEKLSPSLYQKMKSMPRPSSLGFAKSDSGHFNLDSTSNANINACERNEITNQPLKSLKPIGTDDSNKSLSGFQKQKSHEFASASSLPNTQDSGVVKSGKTSSIFSPDSKIPPQNILSSLEKDMKKNTSSAHRSHSSNKTPPNSTSSSKKNVSTTVVGTITTSTTSTTGSLFSPPLPKNVPSIPPRHRTPSSGSEPELIPVLTKLEETPGYENIIRERKIALTPTNEVLPGAEKEKKLTILSDKMDCSSAYLFGSEHKINTKDNKSSDVKSNLVKSDVITQPIASKSVVNVKFPNEIRSDLGAVIYPTNPKSLPVSKSSQGFSLTETKQSLADSVSTVNLLGIEKMVDTSISPAKQGNQFGSATVKSSNAHFNTNNSSINVFGSSAASTMDQTDKVIVDQTPSKTNNSVPNQEMAEVDILSYSEKKRSEKKKKKEKHKHKEKDKDKSERKKEKKKHKVKDKERSKEKEKYKDKDKHKDKERHKEKEIDVVSSEIPIKITIPKDKISGLKFKISKDCLKKEETDSLKYNTSGELKIKISKDVISNIGAYKEESKSDSKKRDRSPKSSSDLPHPKSMKTSEKKSSSSALKSNGTEGPSRNSSSHRHSVSENGSCFDISSLYDFPFDFEENGHGIIKTPDYDFEALNASEFSQEISISPENKEIEDCDKNSQNELEGTKDDCVATSEPEASAVSEPTETCDVDVTCGDITTDLILKPISPLNDRDSPKRSRFINEEQILNEITSTKPSPLHTNHSDGKKDENRPDTSCGEVKKEDQKVSLENCDVLKNYKTILDSHSKRCDSEILNHSVSPVSPEESTTETVSNNDDNNNKNTYSTNESTVNSEKPSLKASKSTSDTENPNYYNKYFKKDGGSRIRSRDDKRSGKGRIDEKNRFDDKQRYYDSRRYRADYNERDRREDRRFYKDYRDFNKESSQYYFERKDERRFEYPGYSSNQYFNSAKPEANLGNLNYDMSGTGATTVYQSCPQTKPAPQFPQICDPTMSTNPDMNVQYQYGYFNNYLYANGGYRFYGNVPYVNMSLIQQQQPIPPGTGDALVQMDHPPLPLEPPPDLPPPPETPPPPPK